MKRSIASPAGGGRGRRRGARRRSCRYSALLTPVKRWMPTGSCTKPVTAFCIGIVVIEWAMVAQGACSLKTSCALW